MDIPSKQRVGRSSRPRDATKLSRPRKAATLSLFDTLPPLQFLLDKPGNPGLKCMQSAKVGRGGETYHDVRIVARSGEETLLYSCRLFFRPERDSLARAQYVADRIRQFGQGSGDSAQHVS